MSKPQEAGVTAAAAKPWQMSLPTIEVTSETTFERAVEIWLSARISGSRESRRLARYVRKNTENAYVRQTKALRLFFEGMRLADIRLDHIVRYQNGRLAGEAPFMVYKKPQDARPRIVNCVELPAKGKTAAPVKPAQVNQEIAMLIRILKWARLWTEETADLYQPLLEEESDTRRALTPEEQERWLATAHSHPRWHLVYWYSLLLFDTAMRTNEIRSLRLSDIDLRSRVITISPEGAKTRSSIRTIPIGTSDAFWALEQLVRRAAGLGSKEHFHYLFPFRDNRFRWYPEKQAAQQLLKRQWEEVRAASGLTWFRPYDTRHTAITRLAEAGVSISVIMKRAGHLSERMTGHYTHVSDQRQIQAAQAAQMLSGVRPAQHQPWAPNRDSGADLLMLPAIQAEIARQVAAIVANLPARRGRESSKR